MSFKPQVKINGESLWTGNSLRFATLQEAEDNANDLARRWYLVTDWRATESEDPVNYRYAGGELVDV